MIDGSFIPVESYLSDFHVYLVHICNLIRFQTRLPSFGREQQQRVQKLISEVAFLHLQLCHDGIV